MLNGTEISVTGVENDSSSWVEKPSKHFFAFHISGCMILGLLLLAFAAFVFNFCLVVSIFCSSSLKKVVMNQLVSYMSIGCLLECIINIPFSLYYIKINNWLPGFVLCNLNTITVLITSLLMTWILCCMCVERCFSLYKLCQKFSSLCKHVVAIIILAIVIGCVVPLLFGLIEVRAFPSRLSCSVVVNREVYYRIIIAASFVFPLVVSLVALTTAYAKNFQGIRSTNCQRTELSYTELFFEESYLWNEWQISKYVGVIFVMFLVLELPSIFTIVKSSTVPYKKQLYNIEKINSTLRMSYPITQTTPAVEKIYVWCKYVFCLVFPLTTLALRKDIRRKLTAVLSFFRAGTSIPNHSSLQSPVSNDDSPDDFLVPRVWRRRRLSSVTCLEPPIIFGKSRSGSVQFMDISTGIAKWKASYESTKNSRVDKPFFGDMFDDEDELTEFFSFQDLTEEELNSSEHENIRRPSVVSKVEETACNSLYGRVNANAETEKTSCSSNNSKLRRNNCISQSFNCSRVKHNVAKYKYYMTFPKTAQNFKPIYDTQVTSTTSELLRALHFKRNNNILATCDLIPRGTEELLDSPIESRDIVSL